MPEYTITQMSCQVWPEFIKFPWTSRIYQKDACWVPPLISEEKKLYNPAINPFHQHAEVTLFMVYENHSSSQGRDSLSFPREKPVARCAAIINHAHNEFHQEKVGFFGCFEALNSPSAAKYLFGEVSKHLKSKGMTVIRGPMNFSTNDTCGLLIEGFDSPPLIMMTYNPTYYLDLMAQSGFVKVKDLYAYAADAKIGEKLPRLERLAQKPLSDPGIKVRKLDLKKIDEEVKKIKVIYNNAWSKNWGFVPMTDAEFDYMAADMKKMVDPDLALIAEIDGQPAGFSLALPDYNQIIKKCNGRLLPFGIFHFLLGKSRIKALRLLTMGVVHQYQKRGLDTVFYLQTIKNGFAKGINFGEFSWILEDNLMMNRILVALGARLYKKYRIYEKPL